jgi:hypothetical protein
MIEEKDRPVTIAVHPKLEFELKVRKEELESITEKPVKGGLTTYSRIAAFELEAIRKSGEELKKEILKLKEIPIYKFVLNDQDSEFVLYEHFKKLFIYTSILNKKKDQQQINVDLTKLKGLKKNNVEIYW